MNKFFKPIVETLHCNVSTALILLMLCCFYAPANAALTDGLVAYWNFDDCTANDKSGKGNNGTKYGTQCVQGKIGKALDFNGTSDYVLIPDSTTLSGFSGLTLSAWIYKPTNNLTDIQGGIITKWYQYSPNNTSKINQDTYAIYAPDFIQAYTNNYVDYDHRVIDTNPTPLNQWFHAVFTHSNTSGGKLYVNGKLKASINTGGNIVSSSNPVILGADNNQGTIWRFFQGKIDEARIYNRALTAAEVTALYQQGLPPTITSITPTVAVLNQATTFTLKGTNLTSGMGFTIGDCEYSNAEVPGTGTATQRQFRCTPRGTAGQKTGYIKTKPAGTRLYSFDVKIFPSTTPPIIVDVTPKVAVLNTPTEFTVYGGNLTPGMGFTIADCDTSNTEVTAKATARSRTFLCNIRGTTAGRRVGIVKNAPKQLSLHYFDVFVKNAATDLVPAPAVGNSIVYNSNVKLVDVLQLRGISQTRVVFSPQMKTAISSWVAGKTMFKIGSIIRKVRVINAPNANGTIPIDTSIPEQSDFLSSLNVSAVDFPLTSSNLAGGISENTTPSLRVQARSSVAAKAAYKISTVNTADVFEFIFTDHVLYDVDGKATTTLDRLIVNGSLVIEKPKLTFKYVSAYFPTPTATADVSFKASEKFDLTYSSQELSFRANKSFPLGTFIVPVPASGGTVYGRLVLFLMFDATGKAQFKAHFIQSVTVDLGYTAKLNGLNLYFPPARNNTSYIAPTFDEVGVTGTLDAKINLNAALAFIAFNYDLSGVNAIAGPSMAIKASVTNGVPCFNFLVNIGASASAYLMLPEVTVPAGYFGWLDTEVKMVKRTKLLFDKNLSKAPYALNGCAT